MLPSHKQKTLAALKRLNGLSSKLERMLEEDAYCPRLLEIALAMKGHIKHIQGIILESHLHSCAPKRMSKNAQNKEEFISELIKVIGLSSR